jgi:hypothetical protein
MERDMRFVAFVLLALVAVTAAVPADAARRKAVRAWQPAPVVKDCTPLNGRFGYYGNPWCSRAEQQAWDRATARR